MWKLQRSCLILSFAYFGVVKSKIHLKSQILQILQILHLRVLILHCRKVSQNLCFPHSLTMLEDVIFLSFTMAPKCIWTLFRSRIEGHVPFVQGWLKCPKNDTFALLISGLICSSSLSFLLGFLSVFWMKLRSGSQSQTFPLTVYYFWPVDVSCSGLNILFSHTCSLLDNSCWICLLGLSLLAIGWKHIPRWNNKCTLKLCIMYIEIKCS